MGFFVFETVSGWLCVVNQSTSEEYRQLSLVSVIVPTFDAIETVGQQLDALAGQDYDGAYEVIVSDNGSVDGLREWLRARLGADEQAVRYVDASGSAGVSHARNVGAAHSSGELLAFCDADAVVRSAWLRELVETASTADLVSGSLDTSVINSEAAYSRRPLRPSLHGFETDFLPYAPGCNFGVWAEVFRAVHGFDEAMTDGGEDIDFSWRVQLAGYRMAHAGAAIVDYRLRCTVLQFWSQVRRYAVGDVQLYSAYRQYGFTGVSVTVFAGHVMRLLVTNPAVPQALSRSPRGQWVGAAAVVAGHLQGSIRYRTLFL